MMISVFGSERFRLIGILGLVMALALAMAAQMAFANQIDRFAGTYTGSVSFESGGKTIQRDLNVKIAPTKAGFTVDWTTGTYRADGTLKAKSYSVEFQPSERDGVYGAAMKNNVFGKAVPLDPMKGEPYVWGRIEDDTLTVFSLYVYDDGEYEIQQFDRTLVEGGLELKFKSMRDGHVHRELGAYLERVEG
ncbi:hypothetical protein SuNHUV7_31450 (plasmid) [Pseudoseohaeicola sp. NH-UV-7]|uniref:hypothetical protein n=1 Tax=unclassified Sulfitobacter TaxID=196795 RepID=UPI0020C7EA51|nr:hypothetical protein [Sulfitobacter sp. JL08]